jgi:DNA topoisomerase-1
MPLANAGAARQDMDLIWGATLTRAVSMATRRFGSNFLSVGRVQSPTLGLIVQRELERRAHEPEPFWEVTAKFAHPDGDFTAEHTTDRFWKKAEAEAAVANSTSPGTVKEITARKNTRQPPTPLNTTAFTTDASNRLGITPSRAMRIAEDLYMDGYISYPRTDNTVYPKSLDTKELVKQLVAIDDFKAASFLLDKGSLEATRGKKETTDHPPIYPTQAVNPKRLEARSEQHRRVYELVARRFLATFSPPMVTESTRANIETAKGTPDAGSGETYFVRGSVVLDPGFAAIYTYARSADTEIPKLEEGQELDLEGVEMEGKETPPPPRVSQGKLIEMMEERGLGTKATRADIIQKLYDRGYVFGNPPEPSETGIAMSKAFEHYVPRMATPDMTAEMEAEMDQIAAGEMTKDQVLADSRDMLRSAFDEMGDDVKTEDEDAKWRKFAREVWAGMDQDRVLGPCKVCEEAGRKQELAEHAAHHQGAQVRQALRRLPGLGRRQPRLARLLRPDLSAPAAGQGPLQDRGGLLGLRPDAAPPGDPLARPSLEALPERRVPLDGRDEAPPRGTRAGAGGQGGGGGVEGRRRHGRRGQGSREDRRPGLGDEGEAGPQRQRISLAHAVGQRRARQERITLEAPREALEG